jgi:hypothetical protein
MKAVLSRTYKPNQTLGRLIVLDGDIKRLELVTLELPDNGNQKNVSCIPEGVYNVDRFYSASRGLCFYVKNVPNRTAILIHSGNYNKDTRGCILPGLYFEDLNDDDLIDVAESRAALSRLINTVENFKLYII